ncbi:hypothetical protein C6P42_005179, partial [Pichia californica]
RSQRSAPMPVTHERFAAFARKPTARMTPPIPPRNSRMASSAPGLTVTTTKTAD